MLAAGTQEQVHLLELHLVIANVFPPINGISCDTKFVCTPTLSVKIDGRLNVLIQLPCDCNLFVGEHGLVIDVWVLNKLWPDMMSSSHFQDIRAQENLPIAR